MAATLVPLCSADIAPGSARLVTIGDLNLAVFNVEGQFFVTQNACTHGPGSLAEGFIDGDQVECDFHGGRFHIPTGKPSAPPCTEGLQTWDVQVVDGQVCIDPAAPRAIQNS
jgi:nitrite reductase/ring-hydroxylating ferredoxin subunit